MRRAFEETEEKLRQLSQEKQNSQNATTAEKGSTANKLTELNKKYRNQTAEIEVLKTRCKNLEDTLVLKKDELERQRIELRRILKTEARKNSSSG